MTIYTVQKGDTMYNIAKKHHVTLNQMIQANPNIANPNHIMPGMKLKVPAPKHMVPKKEAMQSKGVKNTGVKNTAVKNTAVKNTAVKNTAVKNTAVNHPPVKPEEKPKNILPPPKKAEVKSEKSPNPTPYFPMMEEEKPGNIEYKPTAHLAPLLPLEESAWMVESYKENGKEKASPISQETYPNMLLPKGKEMQAYYPKPKQYHQTPHYQAVSPAAYKNQNYPQQYPNYPQSSPQQYSPQHQQQYKSQQYSPQHQQQYSPQQYSPQQQQYSPQQYSPQYVQGTHYNAYPSHSPCGCHSGHTSMQPWHQVTQPWHQLTQPYQMSYYPCYPPQHIHPSYGMMSPYTYQNTKRNEGSSSSSPEADTWNGYTPQVQVSDDSIFPRGFPAK